MAQSADLVIGIDAGSSSVKAVVATADGAVLGRAQVPHGSMQTADGGAEQNPDDWWSGTIGAVRGAIADASVAAERVAAIGVSGQGCAVTLIDDAGQVVRPAITSRDTRSVVQCQRLREIAGDDILRLNGKTPAPYNADPSLMWLAESEPRTIERARTSLTTSGYLNFRLAGVPVMSVSDASILFAFDLASGAWSEDLISRFGLPRKLYPAVAPGSAIIGEVQRTSAEALGLPAGIPVVAGGEDTSSAALSLGAVLPAQAVLSLGTAGTINAVLDHVAIHADLLTFAHVVPHRYLIGGSTAAFGGALDWLRNAAGHAAMSFEEMARLAADVPAGSNGLIFMPHLSGELQPINDGDARGAFIGLSFATDFGHLVRAVMEGAIYAIAHNLWLMRQMGMSVTELRASGGPTRSSLWCQMMADILDADVVLATGAGGAPLGDALLAAQGAGLISSAAAMASRTRDSNTRYVPQAGARDRYAEMFASYRSLFPRLQPTFCSLANFDRMAAS